MEESETLTAGGPSRRRWRPRRRLVVLGLVVSATLTATALWVDRDRRGDEARALAGCRSAVVAAQDDAFSPVFAMVQYVRPVLDSTSSDRLRDDMYALVSDVADDAGRRLDPAFARCRDVRVWWFHDEARNRHRACLRQLEASRAFLDRLATDGAGLARGWPRRVALCDS